MIEGHGDDAWKYDLPIKADFSSNVLYGALDNGLLAHLQWALTKVTHYPEAGAESLRSAAAKAYDVETGQLLVTNGVTEAIYLIAQAFREREAVIYTPAFAEYADACAAQGMKIAFREWEELRSGRLPGDALVFLCNPNNPTGWSVAPPAFDEYPQALFVVDESYIDFAPAAASVLHRGYGNVLVLRSLTKSCRIPGLRVGFVIGAEPLIARLQDRKMPWSVNRLAIEAGLYIFSHPRAFKVPAQQLRAETLVWQRALRAALAAAEPLAPAETPRAATPTAATPTAATQWKVWNTDTHYFLIDTPAPMKLKLLQEYALLVRDAANFRGLGPHCIRVACGSPEHNELLTVALAECAKAGR
jgi:threonine-phosphate decarboxylase